MNTGISVGLHHGYKVTKLKNSRKDKPSRKKGKLGFDKQEKEQNQ